MNDERTTESGDFARLEDQLQSLRPAEVPDFVQARLQFELGKIQGRREARKAMLAYASAACLLTWFVSTSNIFRNESNDMTPFNPPDLAANRTGNEGTSMVWSLDEVKRIAREIEMPSVSVTSRGADSESVRNSPKLRASEIFSKEGWDRRRWYRELFEESQSNSG